MSQKGPTVMDVLYQALEKSNGKTVDVDLYHDEFPGVKPEMMLWWVTNQAISDRYRRWYPQDHVSFKWAVPPTSAGLVGSVGVVEEGFGEFAPSKLYMRGDDPPGWSSISDEKGTRVAWLHEDFEETPNGMKMHTTFRWPAKTPKKFIKAATKHRIGEFKRLSEFLPWIYNQAAGLDK